MATLTEVRVVRLTADDARWLEEQAQSEDRPEGYLIRRLVRSARLADLETTMKQEINED